MLSYVMFTSSTEESPIGTHLHKLRNNQVKKDHPNIHQYYGDRKEHKDLSKTINYINEKVSIC